MSEPKFKRGDYVRKKSGSWWEGYVRGEYSTEQTPDGVAVQLSMPNGPVQIYPEGALELTTPQGARSRAADEITALRARLEKAEAERDVLQMHSEAKSILRSKTRNDALEEAAKEVDCECKGRDVVLSPNVRSNSPERWEACGDVNCCALAALDIRLLKTPS